MSLQCVLEVVHAKNRRCVDVKIMNKNLTVSALVSLTYLWLTSRRKKEVDQFVQVPKVQEEGPSIPLLQLAATIAEVGALIAGGIGCIFWVYQSYSRHRQRKAAPEEPVHFTQTTEEELDLEEQIEISLLEEGKAEENDTLIDASPVNDLVVVENTSPDENNDLVTALDNIEHEDNLANDLATVMGVEDYVLEESEANADPKSITVNPVIDNNPHDDFPTLSEDLQDANDKDDTATSSDLLSETPSFFEAKKLFEKMERVPRPRRKSSRKISSRGGGDCKERDHSYVKIEPAIPVPTVNPVAFSPRPHPDIYSQPQKQPESEATIRKRLKKKFRLTEEQRLSQKKNKEQDKYGKRKSQILTNNCYVCD